MCKFDFILQQSKSTRHALPGLKCVVDNGIEGKTVSNCRWSPELKHIHGLQEQDRSTQAAGETKGKEREEESDHSPKCFQELLLCNGFNRPVFGVLSNEHLFQPKRVINWIVCREWSCDIICKYFRRYNVPVCGWLSQDAGASVLAVTVLFLFCAMEVSPKNQTTVFCSDFRVYSSDSS